MEDDYRTKKIYQVCNLNELIADKSDSNNNNKENNILCVGGINFNTEQSSPTRNLWNYLPGTLTEINFIKDKFKNDYQITSLNEDKATKSKFIKDLNTSSFEIIHLATHSFYIEFDSSRNPFTRIPISILPQRELRSAILFAKGADFENFKSTERLEEFLDKNLTIAEIIYLPLQQTKLVVLSSCETNIGIPKVYDDIYGNLSLNTAFKYAGAKYVLGTRWEVSDIYSKHFYSLFYTLFKETNDIESSYDNAVKGLKALNSDPFIWGAFILIK